MKKTKDAVAVSGLTVLFTPDEPAAAVVDIVLVSGLGGHPVKTWQHIRKTKAAPAPEVPSRKSSIRDVLRKNTLKGCTSKSNAASVDGSQQHRQQRVLRKTRPSVSRSESKLLLINTKEEPGPRRAKSTSRLKLALLADEEQDADEHTVYWPLDLLPSSCPNIRIMTWGCQTLATKGRLLPAQNTVFDHAADLLHELVALRTETRTTGRALALVAHSLGGVIVKEMLRRSEASSDPVVKDILHSLSAVVFLACPHRDTVHGGLGDAIRSMAGVMMGIDDTDEVLQDLSGANAPYVNLGRQNFIRIWNDYNFKVKTFQEALPLPLELENSQQGYDLRREASYIGDPRERCESVEAHHLDMGKYSSADDPAYRSLFLVLMQSVQNEMNRLRDLTPKERRVLEALTKNRGTAPPQETQRIGSYPGTGLWLYDLPEFRAWHQRSSGGRNRILWIKGCPGSGKSVLLKSLRSQIERQWGPLNSNFVWSLAEGETLNGVFFPGAHRRQYTTSPAGVYRNLLAQLYNQDPLLRKALMARCRRSLTPSVAFDDEQIVTFFIDDYVDQKIETPTRRTFVFVDATDDCGVPYLEDLLYYLSQLAANSDYSVCVATAFHSDVVLDNAIEIVMHQQNVDDILRYVSLNLIAEWEDRNSTVLRIGTKAAGCFLWAEIVVSILNAAIEEGATEELVEEAVAEMPGDIDGLYEWLFSTLSPDEKVETLILMQWVLFSPEPLRLNDLCIAIQLSQTWRPFNVHPYTALHLGPPTSIRDLRRPVSEGGAFDSPSQFYSWVRSRSIGLLELQPQSRGGGSTYEPQGLQCVQVIHESVRNFFLSGRGFGSLAPDPQLDVCSHRDGAVNDFADNAHYSLVRACLSYLNVVELEPLGQYGKLEPASMPADESTYWKDNVRDQRHLVMSSYPFLQYAVNNLVYHLLSPRLFRYHLPQCDILRVFSANRCQIWRRWTALLGCSFADPDAVLVKCIEGPAKGLLDPVFGTRYRLERIFRKLSKQAAADCAFLSTPMVPSSALTSTRSAKPKRYYPLPVSAGRWLDRVPPPQLPSPLTPATPMTVSESMLFSPISQASLLSPASMDSGSSALSPIIVK
ncbi:hypothetical protein SPI_02156 [Niveomyces insectorum RCEF 264]|uniref:Nephrocystin 3-like N-terminal domain-containing protein n=1 Tax=Niveomyces insectorum RCEF 264 TaxID=1081102 RepID=A0A167XTA9_9HYPO|nr:hypothetical protein SPI_02156 [Niveomyces insectorum RCEF 264]